MQPSAAKQPAAPAPVPQTIPAQSGTAPSPQTPSALPTHGTVLFERHASPADEPPSESAPGAPDPPRSDNGASSIRRRPTGRGLQRHNADASAQSGTGTVPSAAGEHVGEQRANSPATPEPCTTGCDPVTLDVTDQERDAPRVMHTTLDLHLNLQTGATAARAKLLVRNGAQVPMQRIVLQVSSSLQWQSARLLLPGSPAGVVLAVHQHRIVTDADHTGAATELVLLLPQTVAFGETIDLDLFYGGTLGSSTERLLRLGAPAERAALSDWDTVSDQFTGLRGFGNVLWTPTAAPLALLATGDGFGNIVDEQRRLNLRTTLGLRLTLETNGPSPGEAFLLGVPRALASVALVPASATTPTPAAESGTTATTSSAKTSSGGVSSSSQDETPPIDVGDDDQGGVSRLYMAEWPPATVGNGLPALFVTAAPEQQGALWVRVWTADTSAAEAVQAAATRVRPMLEDWLGARPGRPLEVLDVPLPNAVPFAADGMFVTPLTSADPKAMAYSLVYPMAQAWLPPQVASTREAWMAEGLPAFLQTLYVERTAGREALLARLRLDDRALATAEHSPDAPDRAPLPLAHCMDPRCAQQAVRRCLQGCGRTTERWPLPNTPPIHRTAHRSPWHTVWTHAAHAPKVPPFSRCFGSLLEMPR